MITDKIIEPVTQPTDFVNPIVIVNKKKQSNLYLSRSQKTKCSTL